MENIGFLLKNARENKNFTQKQVMELIGINRKSLSGYENNVAEPDLATFSTLLNLYEVSADSLLGTRVLQPEVVHNKLDLQLISLFRELDKPHQTELMILLNSLVKYLNR